MDTQGEDILGIHRHVMGSLDKLNLLKNGKSFKFHVQQCKSLCNYILDKLSPYIDKNKEYQVGDVWSEHVQNAWKEIYRALKEAETYLSHCSTDSSFIKCFIMSNTGEAFALHMHDLAWSLLCLDLTLLCPIDAWNYRIDTEFRKKISDFFAEMSDLHLEQFGFKFQDYLHLLMDCNQTVAKAWTFKPKNKIGVLLFMERKLLESIRNECKIESANGIPTWLQIPAKDLIKKKSIGEGSFGKVYEGSWLGHKVAIKEIPIDARDLFDTETKVLGKLQSPFIVQLIGTCIEGSHCYIVMEMISSSLDKLLTNSGGRAPLALPVAVDMMLQISRGMEYLHSQGIMHMDLKASNVLIQPSAVPEFREQGYGRVKLCDFGMASLRLSSFRCEDPKGTCYWRAPEAFPFPNLPQQEIDTLEKYTYKADVYSFAMTCYVILTGKQPFLGLHPKDLYRKIVGGERPSLQQPSCPAVLADFIAMCWETDPNRRPCFAQVSTFMRNMKLIILGWNPPRKVFLELWRSKDKAFDKIPVDKKLKSMSRVLHIVPSEIKRRYNINVTCNWKMYSEILRGGRPTLMFQNMKDLFDLDDLLRSSVKDLGTGTFGTTYKANLHNFSLVVKISARNTNYVHSKRFYTEQRLQALGRLKHPNLVNLQAYYASEETHLLIYDYLPNGSLYSLLHSGTKPLKWERRVEIAVDVALGLAFVHKSGLVHGNVKSSNVLLDDDGRACLKDSCLAEIVKISNPYFPGIMKHPSAIFKDRAPEHQYMAPEQFLYGKMCEQSDVYSFGVLLFELLTGKDPSRFTPHLPTWVLSNKVEGRERARETFDRRLRSHIDILNIWKMYGIAANCTSLLEYSRPRMSEVVEMIANLVGSC